MSVIVGWDAGLLGSPIPLEILVTTEHWFHDGVKMEINGTIG
jgi:hypothetical protein